jgi:MFS family permease
MFKIDVFSVSMGLSFLMGILMFGAIIFLPQYQQLVRGDSATKSGLMMLPLVIGLMGASLTSGRLISKSGRYRLFPIIGTLWITISFWLFSHITATTNRLMLAVWMLILGVGIGLVMPVLTLAVQNAVNRKDLGTATSAVAFSRSIGSSLGAAIFGAILTNRLTLYVQQSLPGSAGVTAAKSLRSTSTQLHTASPQVVQVVMTAFSRAFHDVFLVGVPIAAVGFCVSMFLKESPLHETTEHAEAVALAESGQY